MEDNNSNYEISTSCEASEDLNGKNASYRTAPMLSAPKVIQKMRVRGALVPMGNKANGTPTSFI
jgi:hypothetical protein